MRPIKTALLVLILAGGALSAMPPAGAQTVAVGVNLGGIAFGYSDGYWDRGHRWHAWRNHREMVAWREANAGHYYAWRHDRDRSMGWREERWWGR